MERRESPRRNDAVSAATGEQQSQAIASYRAALSRRWVDPQTHCELGLALIESGLPDEAVASFRTALAQRQNFPEAWCELGRALLADSKRDEAIDALRKALEQNPTMAAAYFYLGSALQQAGHFAEAIVSFRMASILRPDSPEAHYNLGMALAAQGGWEQAIEAYRAALKLRPVYAEAYNNLGNCLQRLEKLDEAATSIRKAIILRPKDASIHSNLGNTYKDMGRLDDAIPCYGRASHLQPDCELWRSNRVYALHFKPGVEPEALLQEHLEWDRQYGQPLAMFIRAHENDRTADRRLRIGYISADFRGHVVGRNIVPLIREHDRRQFEIFCYYNFGKEDDLTAWFREHADGWRTIAGMTDEQVVNQVQSDTIDILVDLSLHMAGNRLTVFARKPAPVQVTFAGYPSGTGLSAIDYRLTDPYLDPIGVNDRFYREQSIRLPHSFWCFDPTSKEPAVSPLPAAARGGRVTFGCLNNFCKVNEPLLQLWAAVLRAVPNSTVLLLAPRGSSRDRVSEVLEHDGIERSRIEFADRQPRESYLKLYDRVDVVLDTLPYNGHTTTLEGLWMGVPVITRVGKLAVSRAGLSQLSNTGLAALAADTDEAFVQIATTLASDIPRLEQLRSTLRYRMSGSPLTNAKSFTCDIEKAYRDVWRRWCTR
jgi:protein O-GlcNAc transferase